MNFLFLKLILPIVLVIIFICLYLAFRSIREAFYSLVTIPFALIGGAYLVYFYDVNLSVAVAVGFIALFGIAVETETGIKMAEKLKIVVMLGGPSAERKVSLRSGEGVAQALRSLGHTVTELDPEKPDWILPQ